jgi:dTDP-4-dehydrorhamnose reductase
MMRILLLGKTGLLGSEFFDLLSRREDIELVAPTHRELDLLNALAVDAFLAGQFFDRIIDCVGYTEVDSAETERGRCKQLNIQILETLLSHRQPIIHFSTDYVFNIPLGEEICENRERVPLNYYGETKFQAEKLLEQYSALWWNIRTSWLFGSHGKNFITTIREKSVLQPSLRVVGDEIGRPTFAVDLAKFVIEEFVDKSPASGHFHLQNTGESCSWADLAEEIFKIKKANISVKRVTSVEFPQVAKRPAYSVLKNKKGPEMADWREMLKRYLG